MFHKRQTQYEPPQGVAKRPTPVAAWLTEEARSKACAETPRSNISAGLEASAFGSGSSVLSQYEPPTDADLSSERVALSQLLEHTATSDANLEELEAVINKLQAIYFYRQGLKALAEQSMGGALLGVTPIGTGASTPWSNSRSFSSNSTSTFSNEVGNGHTFLYEPPSSLIPGPGSSIWRMDTSNGRQSFSTTPTHQMLNSASTSSQYPGVVSTQELASLARLQYQLYQDTLRQYKTSRQDRGQRQLHPSRSTRHSSAPVMLRAPQWADSSWHPMTAVISKGRSSGTGTGVFIPPSSRNSTNVDAGTGVMGSQKGKPGNLGKKSSSRGENQIIQ